ncbi:MAG: hypothetical protein AAB110_05130, partial [Candidatus Desantisbacteria bacterium]
LKCSINTYPGATCQYQWRVGTETTYDLKGSATDKGSWIEETSINSTGISKGSATQVSTTITLKGSATQMTDYIQLTSNSSNKNGQVEYSNLNLGNKWSVKGEFWTGGTVGGADAFYIYAFANQTPTNEDRGNGQYSINYDEYDDQIQFKYNGNTLGTIAQTGIDNSAWRQFKVVCNSGTFEIYLDGQLKITYNDSANYSTRTTNSLCGFGARTGGLSNEH